MMMTTRRIAATAGSALLALSLAACSSGEDTTTDAATSESTPQDTATGDSEPATGTALTFTDAWTKSAEEGMSAAFGILENPTDADIVVVGVSSPASSAMELHETVMNDGSMMMQQVDGFTIPAGGEFLLEPGGNHLMFMDLTGPILPGDEVEVTLDLQDGSTVSFVTSAREFTGADEEYADDDMDMDMDMDMDGDHEDSEDHEDSDDHSDQ